MAALDTPPLLPPQLQPEPSPTVNNLKAQIEDWVIYELLQTASSKPRYENYLYGPIASFLASIFPSRRRYMSIPQAVHRNAVPDDEIEEDLTNVSFGSTGAFHMGRENPGVEANKKFPDFVVVKVTPQPDLQRSHYIVCIMEVKRNTRTESTGKEQLGHYMRQAANLPSRVGNLCGYLVMATKVRKCWLEGGDVVWENIRFRMTDPGDRLTRELCNISVANWNYQA